MVHGWENNKKIKEEKGQKPKKTDEKKKIKFINMINVSTIQVNVNGEKTKVEKDLKKKKPMRSCIV